MISPKRALLLKTLMTTTALGGALALSAPAMAADECGAPVNGVVTCRADDGPYGAVSYTAVDGVTLNIEAGAEAGSVTMTGTGSLAVVAGEGSSLSASGANARGIAVNSADGSVNVVADLVGATGANAIGISATGIGDVDVLARSVNASGQHGSGIVAYSYEGSVRVKAGTIEQASDSYSGYGISAGVWDGTKSIDVEVDSVSVRQLTPTVSNGVIGVLLYWGGEINLKAGSIAASGFDAKGVAFDSAGDVVVDIGKISVAGQYSRGITFGGVYANPGYFNSIKATVDEVEAGAGSIGVRIYGGARDGAAEWDNDLNIGRITGQGSGIDLDVRGGGDLRLQSGAIDVGGSGIRAFGSGNRLLIQSGSVRTSGFESNGILFSGRDAELMIDSDTVSTSGERATGIFVEFAGEETRASSVHSGSITTTGDEAVGLYAKSYDEHGNPSALLTLTSQAISTSGVESHGVWADYAGALSLVADDIETSGDDAIGVLVTSGDEVSLDLNKVTTHGLRADGIVIAAATGDYLVKANTVTTTGDDARGVVLGGADATRMTAELGTVTTSGEGATAVSTSWDGNSGNAEAVAVKAGVLSTTGDDAMGAYLYANDLTLDIETITTLGDSSTGAFLNAYGGDDEAISLRGRIGSVDTTGVGAAGVILQNSGLYDLTVGSLHTRGDDATGFRSNSSADVGGILTIGSVLTEGDEAQGVELYSELGGHDVSIQSLETRGDGAWGLQMVSAADSEIALGTVRTSGDGARGVYATVYGGALELSADDVRTVGADSTGVRAAAEAGLTLALGYIDVTGSESDAVQAISLDALTLTATRRLGSASGVAADLTGETIDVTLASTAVVEGGAGGLLLASQDGATVRNAGSISSANGFAIEAETGKVTLENSGLVTGRIAFAGEDDVVNNSGRFAAALTSNFGGGDDVFNNTGVLSLADPTATAPRSAFFNNLERLNNAGTIDLTNGVAGDVFEVSGLINGQAGGRIGLDLDLRGATPTADRIVAGGFEGLSEIVLTLQGRASLGDTGVVIAESGMAQTGQEMKVRVAGGGFVGFDVAFADGEYRISGELVPPAFEPTKVATGAQHQWTSGADVVSARFEQMRDEGGRPDGRGDQVWAQVYGGSNDIEAKRSFDLLGESLDADLSHEVKSQGVQAGVDRAVPIDDGSLVFGMLAGAGKTELRFQNGDVTEYDGVGVGAYGHWFSGPLSIGVVAKLDTFKLDYDWAEANLKTRSNGFTVGARVDAAWRIQAGQGWYVEPQASLSWADTALGRLKARDGAEVVFGDTTSVVGRIGVRAGAEMAVGDGLSFKPFAAVHALNEFDGDNASTLLLGDEAVGVTDRAHGAWGRAVLGASLDAPSGLGGFIQAEGDFGEVEGFTARAGVKFSW